MEQIDQDHKPERDPDGRERPGVDLEPLTNPVANRRQAFPRSCGPVSGGDGILVAVGADGVVADAGFFGLVVAVIGGIVAGCGVS
ncbi:hypothetical protein GCM10008992_16080 [Halorubrum aquaticum]